MIFMLTETDKLVLEEVHHPNHWGRQNGVRRFEHGIVTAIKEHVMDYEDACKYAIEKLGAKATGLNHWLNQVQGTSGLLYIDNLKEHDEATEVQQSI